MVPNLERNMPKKSANDVAAGKKRKLENVESEQGVVEPVLDHGVVIKKAKKAAKKETKVKEKSGTTAVPTEAKLDLKKRLLAENEFVTGLVALMYIPQHKAQNGKEDSDDNDAMDVSEDVKKKFMAKTSRANNAGELQERLQKKLAELRGHRDEGKKRTGKLTKVERRQKAIEAKKMQRKLLKAGKVMQEAKSSDKKNGQSGNKTKPVYNSEGKMVFSKFDFTEDSAALCAEKKQTLDPKSSLQKIKKHKEKLKSLAAIGKTERVKNLEDKTAWKAAIDKAEGVKVKDDETLLKKSIKKLEQKKKSSKKKWEERDSHVSKKKESQQHKRTENIQNRKEQVKKSKFKKAAKKGRVVPGFR